MNKIAGIVNKTLLEILRQQAGLFARDAMKITPPFGASSVRESYGKQYRTGQAAVDHDVDLTFRPVDSYWILKSDNHYAHGDLGAQIREAIQKNNWLLAEFLLNKARLKPAGVIPDATIELHKQKFDKAFRVRGRKYAVKNKASIGRVKLALRNRVGIAKAGWMEAYTKYGRTMDTVPNWIKRHQGIANGRTSEKLSDTKPEITLENPVPYVQDRADEMIPLLYRLRTNAVLKEAKALERWQAKKLREAGELVTVT